MPQNLRCPEKFLVARLMNDFILLFLGDTVIGCSTEGASYCCFRKVVSNKLFQEVLLINFISIYANMFQLFILACFLLIEDYGKRTLRKEPVICHCLKQLFFESVRIRSYSGLLFFRFFD